MTPVLTVVEVTFVLEGSKTVHSFSATEIFAVGKANPLQPVACEIPTEFGHYQTYCNS